MLAKNTDVARGLVNGARGVVVKVDSATRGDHVGMYIILSQKMYTIRMQCPTQHHFIVFLTGRLITSAMYITEPIISNTKAYHANLEGMSEV